MQPLPSASTWAGPRLRPRRRQLPANAPVPTERGAALAGECEHLLEEAQRLVNRMIERTRALPPSSEGRRRATTVLGLCRARLQTLAAGLGSRNALAALVLLLSVMPSIVYYQIRIHRNHRPAPVPVAAPAPAVRPTPARSSPPAPRPSTREQNDTIAPAVSASLHLGRIGGIRYRYSHERDGVRILIEPISASNYVALASIIVAVIEDTYGSNKLVSLIPYVVPGESGNWLKFKGGESDYFAAVSYVAEDPGRINGCYVWARPKD